ncbi:MAG TPA: hypothetical protein VN085_03000 [Vicinamibacterales bacterium]|nr:hypothetical protein [Vicinamibacterales bacterium]
MSIVANIPDGVQISLEPGHSVWLQSDINDAAVIQAHWPGAGLLTVTFDTDTWGESYAALKRDPRGAPTITASDQLAFLDAEAARVAERQAQRNVKRVPPPTLALRAFGQGRETPFRGFP